MSTCPDENALLDFSAGDRTPELEAHLASCERCRFAVSQLITTGPSIRASVLASGALVGRYVIVGLVGEGAMGRVYAAFDPVLDRKVALKLLHPLGDGPTARSRMLGEAQALARVSHPHLVGVHDAGEHDGSVYLAMEFIEGPTLRRWQSLRILRPDAKLLELYLQAARGLAAIHEAGLVHRDFKPENVLVGSDGRVRVSDFGLARAVSRGIGLTSDLSGSNSSATSSAGTPAYMAPEHLEGAPFDARADQFAFCLALAEALTGARPFERNDREAVIKGPQLAGAPIRLARVLRRGLRLEPERRFATLHELITALDPTPRTPWALIAAAVVVVTLGIAAIARFQPAQARCLGSQERVDAVWSADRRRTLSTHFASLGADGAARFASVSQLLERTLGGWAQMHRENCEATRVRGDQSDQLFAARGACLNRRLLEVDATLEVLASTTRDSLSRATDAVTTLTPISVCANTSALQTSSDAPENPRVAPRLETLERELASASALRQTGRLVESLDAGVTLVREAQALEWHSREAQALLLLGGVESEMGNLSAETALREAWLQAVSAREDRLAVLAALDLAYFLTEHARFLEAKDWLWIAKGMLTRVGADLDLVARVTTEEGHQLYISHQFPAAHERYDQAHATRRKLQGDADVTTALALLALANTIGAEHNFDEALRLHLLALSVLEPALGLGHPRIGQIHISLSEDYLNLRREAEAETALDAVLPAQIAAHGEDSLQVGRLYEMKANVLNRLGRPAEALPLVTRALKTFEAKGVGRNTLFAMTTIGYTLLELKRYDEAHTQLASTRDFISSKFGPDDTDITVTYEMEGEALLWAKRCREALPLLSIALARRDKGQDEVMIGYTSSLVGRCQLALGDRGRARETLKRAVAFMETTGVDPESLTVTKDAYAAAQK